MNRTLWAFLDGVWATLLVFWAIYLVRNARRIRAERQKQEKR